MPIGVKAATRTRPARPPSMRSHSRNGPPCCLCSIPKPPPNASPAATIPCPDADCSGQVVPWGAARTRPVRLLGGGIDWVIPRRGRCRHCDRSHVFVPVRAFPRRTDSVETVWAALAAAAHGQGHRPIAHQLGLPPSTVRGWLRRARANGWLALKSSRNRRAFQFR